MDLLTVALVLFLVGVGLGAAEIFIPSAGVLAVLSVAAFVGSIIAAFQVSVDLGMIKLKSGFLVPKEGDGIWYLPFGRQLFELPLSNIQWTGNAFHADITLLGQGGISMDGVVSADGSIEGTFDTGEFDARELGGLDPKGFTGSRFVKKVDSVSSD